MSGWTEDDAKFGKFPSMQPQSGNGAFHFHSVVDVPVEMHDIRRNITECLWSAIFNFQSLLTVILLLICTCAYIRALAPSLLDKNKSGILGIFWKCARIGERKSPWVAFCCVLMAFSILFVQ